jgi:hypothetical protein
MADDNNINDAVSQLVDQLQNNTMNSKQIQAGAPLQGQDLEKFLLEYSGKLIKGSVDFVEDLKTYVASAPTAEDVSAMATLVSSSAAAIETLNKILIAKQNNENRVRIKNMDIEAKKQLQDVQIQGKMLMNREELLRQLIDEAKIVNVEAEVKEL